MRIYSSILVILIATHSLAIPHITQQVGSSISVSGKGYTFGESLSLTTGGAYLSVGDRAIDYGQYYQYYSGYQNLDANGAVFTFAFDSQNYQTYALTANTTDSDLNLLDGRYGDTDSQMFGISQQLSDDGDKLVVGTKLNEVYVYHKNESTWYCIDNPNDSSEGEVTSKWGESVAISGNGNVIAVAASYQYANQPGYVDLFEWNGSAWVQQGSSITGKTAGDYFGLKMAVSYDGRGIAISGYYAGKGYTQVYYSNYADQWIQKGTDFEGSDISGADRFGESLALSFDYFDQDMTLAIGYRHGNGRRVNIYSWSYPSWNLVETLNPGTSYNAFGIGLDINRDGDRLVVADTYSHKVYAYDWNYQVPGQWENIAILSDYLGSGDVVDMDSSGDYFAIRTGNGYVKVFKLIAAKNITWYANGPGSILVDGTTATGTQMYDADPSLSLTAEPLENSLFTGWSAAIVSDYTQSQTNFYLDPDLPASMTITANFSYDADGDSVYNQLENALGTDPREADDMSSFVSQITSYSSMMTEAEAQAAMRDLRVGSQTFGVSNGNAKIRMYVDESSDLTSTWSNTQHVLELDIPADADTKFYRFRMD